MRKTGAMQKGILTAVFLLIMTSLAVASTNVSGQISTNTTWTTTGSPYIVTGDVRVYATSSTPVLTIQAGVTVKFNSGTGLYIGNGASTGKLTANGTATDYDCGFTESFLPQKRIGSRNHILAVYSRDLWDYRHAASGYEDDFRLQLLD